MRSDRFRPLRVTAHLRCGVVCDPFLPLDGILLYQAFRKELGFPVACLPGQYAGPEEVHITLPLLIRNEGEPDWYYACSFAYPQPWWVAEGQDHWNKRFDVQYSDFVDFRGRRGKVEIQKGRYRAYHMPIFYRVAPKITWYCVGDPDAIARLLYGIFFIGKKRVQGWGNVIRWEVEEWPQDWSERDGEGRLTRAIPYHRPPFTKGLSLPENVRLYGIRPPYWDRRNQRLVLLP